MQSDSLPHAAGPAHGAHVVVADDDADMRALVAQALELDGHHIVEASTGKELLGVVMAAERAHEACDLVLTDLRMPELSGLEAARALRAARWNAPLILMSAFIDAKLIAEAEQIGGVTVLSKPFTLADLRQATRAALRRSSAPPEP